jgi:hypothetical protein
MLSMEALAVASQRLPESGWFSTSCPAPHTYALLLKSASAMYDNAICSTGTPAAGELNDQPIDWIPLRERVLRHLGAPFQFKVEQFRWPNGIYYAQLGEAARMEASERAVAEQVQNSQQVLYRCLSLYALYLT